MKRGLGWLVSLVMGVVLMVSLVAKAEEPFYLPLTVSDPSPDKVYASAFASEYPTDVIFDASDSVGYNGASVISYDWDFGDGTIGSGDIVTNSYIAKGTNQVLLTVVDDNGVSRYACVKVYIFKDAIAPQYSLDILHAGTGVGTVTLSPAGGVYNENTVVTLTASTIAGNTFVDWSGDLIGSTTPAQITMTGNKSVTATFDVSTPASELIVDNVDAVLSGTWNVNANTTYGPYVGINYLSREKEAGIIDTVTFTPNLPVSGDWDVYHNNQTKSYGAQNVKVVIVHANGTSETTIDQKRDRGWVLVGTYTFNAGTGGSVMLSNEGVDLAPATVFADAVKFVSAGGVLPPVDHTITASSGANGAVSPIGDTTVAEGGSQVYTISGNSGYEIADVLVDGSSVGVKTSHTFSNVTSDHTISATFQTVSVPQYSLDILHAGTGVGTVALSPAGGVYDENTVVTLTASTTAGNTFVDWSGDLIGSTTPAQITMTGNKSVTATFDVSAPSVEVIVDNVDAVVVGTWNVNVNTTYGPYIGINYLSRGKEAGIIDTVTFTPNLPVSGDWDVYHNNQTKSYGAQNVKVVIEHANGTSETTIDQKRDRGWVLVGTYTFNAGTGGSVMLSNEGVDLAPATVFADAVKFVSAGGVLPPVDHTITASSGANGAVSPIGDTTVAEGGSQVYTISGNSGYEIADVLVDGSSVGVKTSHTFSNVTSDHTISATFQAISVPQYSLNVLHAGTGVGTVTLSPAGGVYDENTVVTLTASTTADNIFVDWSGDLIGSTTPAQITMTGNKSVTATFDLTNPTLEVVVDNLDAVLSGTWKVNTGTVYGDYIGVNYLSRGAEAGITDTVTFTPNLPTSGDWDVYHYNQTKSYGAQNVKVVIEHANGTSETTIDQKSDRGWVLIGTYTFNAGVGGSVMLSNEGVNLAPTTVFVDAVKFMTAGSAVDPLSSAFTATALFEEPIASAATILDDDGDGMPNSWELPNGLNPLNKDDALFDDDDDGFNNLDEYIAGTNPDNDASLLYVSNLGVQSSATLSFDSVPGRVYGVEYKDDLNDKTWESLVSDIPGTGDPIGVSDPDSVSHRFYRVTVGME